MTTKVITPSTLKNFALFVAKSGAAQACLAGLATDVSIPKLSFKTEDFRAGGMDAPIPVEVGMEPLSCDFSLAEYNLETLKLLGLFDNKTQLTFRGAFDNGSEPQPITIKLNGVIKEADFGSWKTGSLVTFKASFVATYYQLIINNNEIIEIDIPNMVRKIDGKDQLESWRNAIFGG